MEQKIIELNGIVRNLPDSRVADGTMQEVINLRPEDGAWRPVGPKLTFPTTTADVRCIHSVNEEYKIYLGTPVGHLWYWVFRNDVLVATVNSGIVTTNKEYVFTQLHKSLMVSNTTDKTTSVFVFDIDSERYRIIDEQFPEAPKIWFACVPDPLTADDFFPLDGNTTSEMTLGYMLEKIANWTDRYPAGPVAFRYAWEMADGSLIRLSQPIYLNTSVFESEIRTISGTVWVTAQILMGNVKIGTDEAPEVLAGYKTDFLGLIRSLNIYMTRLDTPIVGIVADANGVYLPTFRELSIKDNEAYYLIHSIPLDKIDAAETWSVAPGAVFLPGPFNDLELSPSMGADNFTHHRIAGNNMFAYNERIFMGDITTQVFAGYDVMNFILPNGSLYTGTPYTVNFEVDLFTSDGIKTVMRQFTGINYYLVDGATPSFMFKRYFAYPDARAKTLRIFVRIGTGTRHLVATLTLTSHELLNFSWYNGASDESGVTVYGKYTFTGPLSNYPVTALTTVDDTYRDSNRIQATEQSNPFYFPAINSYRIGNGKILGMSSNAVALSQGQFGHYPIFCFTSDGIWTMNIGTGDPLISTIVPVSREVCNNAGSITQIDGGTVFTTEKGLMIISGPVPVEISDLAEGNYLSRLTGTVNYEAIANNPNLYQVRAYLCNVGMLAYISGAFIGWDHIHKEIIVSNPAKTYSWIYSLKVKVWFKISESWERFIPDFPKTYGYRAIILPGGGDPLLASSTVVSASDDNILASEEYTGGSVNNFLCDISQEDFAELVPVHMETRPMKITPRRFKKIQRMLIGGIVNDTIDNPFSVNLFGSPDNRSWYILNASTTFNSRRRLLIGRSSFSCQYFILVIGGRVDEEAYFTHLEVDYEERYTNKLR